MEASLLLICRLASLGCDRQLNIYLGATKKKKKKIGESREAETGSKKPLALAVLPNVHINLKQRSFFENVLPDIACFFFSNCSFCKM